MKLLVVHLSDAHFVDRTYISDKIVEAQVRAINSLGEHDKYALVFSGDLSYSGKQNELKRAGFYLGRLWRNLSTGKEKDAVSTFVVPGNHDIDFQGKNRNRTEICDLLSEGITPEIINEELAKFDNFYSFSQYYKCFLYNKLVDVKYLKVGEKTIQFNLINSELFSTCNDENGDDDKGKHYLPESEWNKLSRGKDVNLVVTVSHRGPEWFDWESSNSFKKSLYCNTDLFLYGHEHVNDLNLSCQKDNNLIKSIAQGINFNEKQICFTVLSIDIETNHVDTHLFKWDNDESIFVKVNNEAYTLNKAYSDDYLIRPCDEFKKQISLDDDHNEVGKYFVFPGVEILGQEKYAEVKEYSEFLSLVCSKKHVVLEGENASGKTALLYKIYLSLIGNYVPIYLNVLNLHNNNPEKAIRVAFEQQYGCKATDFEKFCQVDKVKKVVLIDDLDKIKEKYIAPLEKYLYNSFGHVVSVVAPKWEVDLVNLVKEELEESEEIAKYRLLPFYLSKRLQLVKNLISIYGDGGSDVDKQAEEINKFICDQIKLFTLSPKFINIYVEYWIKESEMATNTNKNVFGRVFENNLLNSIRKFASDGDIDEYCVLLEEIAYVIHFDEKYPISATELSQIVDKYNDDHMLKVSVSKFCEVMTKAKILIEEENSYTFYNNNYLAYFVAKSLNSRYQNNEGNGELEKIAKNICFNINGDILLFLSYITTNMSILKFILDQAEEHMKDWPEFSIDEKNIGFIFSQACPIIAKLPTAEDRKNKDERHEKFEKAVTAKDKIEKKDLYDYDKKDVELKSYKLGQAMRLTNLVCKILPGFNHRLKKNEKEDIVKNIYVLPNKIIFNVLRSLDEDFEKIVKTIQEMLKTENEEVAEEEIKKALIRAAETFILNTYDQSARLSVTDKTMPAIELFDRTSTNYTIQHIMMRENLGDFKGFTSQADKLYDKTELSIVKSMITRIVHKHFLYHKKLRIVGDVERVAKKYFGESVKKVDFLK